MSAPTAPPDAGSRIAILVLQKYAEGADVDAELREYTAVMLDLLDRVGGRIVWAGQPRGVIIGDSERMWDAALIVEYPNADAAAAVSNSPEFRDAIQHRQAAFAALEVYACTPVVDAVRG